MKTRTHKPAIRIGYSARNWPPMVAPEHEPTIRDIVGPRRNTWAVLTFDYHTRRWDYWCSFSTQAKAEAYCDGKFVAEATQRIVRVNARCAVGRIVARGNRDQLAGAR